MNHPTFNAHTFMDYLYWKKKKLSSSQYTQKNNQKTKETFERRNRPTWSRVPPEKTKYTTEIKQSSSSTCIHFPSSPISRQNRPQTTLSKTSANQIRKKKNSTTILILFLSFFLSIIRDSVSACILIVYMHKGKRRKKTNKTKYRGRKDTERQDNCIPIARLREIDPSSLSFFLRISIALAPTAFLSPLLISYMQQTLKMREKKKRKKKEKYVLHASLYVYIYIYIWREFKREASPLLKDFDGRRDRYKSQAKRQTLARGFNLNKCALLHYIYYVQLPVQEFLSDREKKKRER